MDWTRTMDFCARADGQYPLLLELREVAGMEHPSNQRAETSSIIWKD